MLDSIEQDPDGDKWTTHAGQKVMIRPICGDDEDGMSRFHRSLSPETVYTRYFNALKLSERIAHDRLDRICHPVPGDEAVLVVETAVAATSGREIIGVGRLSVLTDMQTGEIAFVVSDSYQGQGIGTELLHRLLTIAQRRKLYRLCAHILPTNVAMQRICLNMGMQLIGSLTDSEVTAEIDLSATARNRGLRENTIETPDCHCQVNPNSDVVSIQQSTTVENIIPQHLEH